MSELDKLNRGEEYCFFDEEVASRKERANDLCEAFNRIPANDFDRQMAMMPDILGSYKDEVYIQPPFYFDVGKNIHVGKEFLTNYNVTILDVAPVYIGDHCMIGPNVLITTVNHPLSPLKRRAKKGVALPVYIGNDVWIGGHVTILPDVRIGNNVVIGAGAVVTKDIPDNVVVAGIPAKIIKEIDED